MSNPAVQKFLFSRDLFLADIPYGRRLRMQRWGGGDGGDSVST